jgi:hypothetical protein
VPQEQRQRNRRKSLIRIKSIEAIGPTKAKLDSDGALVSLHGSLTRPPNQGGVPRGCKGIATETITWNVGRNIKPLKVVVDIPEYDTWIPKGTRDFTKPGNWPLLIKAELRNQDGSPAKEKATKISFELVTVSHQPGVCMNYPPLTRDDGLPNAEDEAPDLQFDDLLDKNVNLVILDDKGRKASQGPKAETPPGSHSRAQAQVGVFDFGAYGELLVTAEMPDGQLIVGYPKWDESDPDIRIPKRKQGSRIATAWKSMWAEAGVSNIFDLPDDDDGEDDPRRRQDIKPPGPGMCPGPFKCMGAHPGDGLTLYEEYRGFYVGGKHVRGHPAKKDLFIYNTVGGDTWGGIMHFEALTGMVAHDGLKEDEIGPKQVVNFNLEYNENLPPELAHGLRVWVNANVNSWTPTRGKQYGILIAPNPDPNWARGMGHPGVLKKVAIERRLDDPREYRTGEGNVIRGDYGERHMAHELLHCCNVRHHGDNDLGWVYWNLAGDKLVEMPVEDSGAPNVLATVNIPLANVRWESGPAVSADMLRRWLGLLGVKDWGVKLYVARQGGQHSGYQDCVMRYCVAAARIPPAGDRFRVLSEKAGDWSMDFEPTGMSLCDQKEDSAAPRGNLPKLDRYGDATFGYCRSQICINDPQHKHASGGSRP